MQKLTNHLQSKLAAGNPVIGAAVTVPSPQLMRILVDCGFDWLAVDMEHGAIGPEAAQAMINATQGSDCMPLVRLPSSEAWMAKMPLDMGAMGLFFPLIMTAEEADCAVKSALYPPIGTRGFAPIHASYRWRRTLTEYAADADDIILKIIMIEHVDAVRQLDRILEVPNIDLIFVAPYDLSQSLGLAGQFEHEIVKQAIKQVEDTVFAAGIDLGGYASSVKKGQELLGKGYKLIMFGYDGVLLETAISPLIKQLTN